MNVVIVKPNISIPVNMEKSYVFNLSYLMPSMQKEFVRQFIMDELARQIGIPKNLRRKIVYVFEESQLYFSTYALRRKRNEPILRLVTCGRNFEMSFMAIT
ncbi:MAG: hypothetical protein U9O89_01275 [Thermoproteota archaeon]|nr:hypothetical protein [Thermoproteota archaeon]